MDDERLMGSVPEAVKETDTVEASNKAKTQTIEQAAKELGIGRNQAYAAAKRGEIPIIRIGKRILVLREPSKKMLAVRRREKAKSALCSGPAKTCPASR